MDTSSVALARCRPVAAQCDLVQRLDQEAGYLSKGWSIPADCSAARRSGCRERILLDADGRATNHTSVCSLGSPHRNARANVVAFFGRETGELVERVPGEPSAARPAGSVAPG